MQRPNKRVPVLAGIGAAGVAGVAALAFAVPLLVGHLLLRTPLSALLVGVDRVGSAAPTVDRPSGEGRLGAVLGWVQQPIRT